MKIDPRRIDAFLRDPGAARVVLFYGGDAGLIRERASELTRRVAGSTDDPFRVVEMPRDRLADLASEMAADALVGGRRVIRVRDATDGTAEAIGRALQSRGPGLLIMEAGDLPSRSKLRTLIDSAPDTASIACPPADGRARSDAIKSMLETAGISADADAMAWLALHLGDDRAMMRGEIEKLALAIGGNGVASSAAVRESVGDLAGLSLDDALFAALAGDVAAADRALDLAMAEGASAVQIVRAAALHFQRLHMVCLAAARGSSPSDAVRGVRPPIFFLHAPRFAQAASRWPIEAVSQALASLSEAERACKRSAVPADLVARMSLIGLARRAAAFSRRV